MNHSGQNDHFTRVAEGFSRKAQVYDEFGQDHPNLARIRREVRTHVTGLLPPGGRILELNAGTGEDAVYFVQHGYSVHATDISPGMLAKIRSKIDQFGLGANLTVQDCSFIDLDQVQVGPFDLIFSDMGGLNCTDNLSAVARSLPSLLKQGGFVTWVIMPTVCLWELSAALRGDWRVARRRSTKGGVMANVEGVRFMTYYYTPQQVFAAFPPGFEKVWLRGLAVFTPPADHKNMPIRYPRLYKALSWLDDRLAGRTPFNRWGDFFVLTLHYVGAPGEKRSSA